MSNTKPMVLVTKETVINSIIIEVPEGVEDVEAYCHEYAADQAENDEWKRGDEDEKEEMEARLDKIKNISVGTDKTPPPKKEEKKSKHQDLFDELFGDS